MNSVLYSWLAAAAVSPFVAILSCWTLAIFRSYHSEWRLLDIFLFALTTLEGVSALFSFGYSVLGVIRPALEAPCRFLLWGTTATRTFHLSTVTSLLLDRALSSKWPKTYRASVRQSQVRYHIVVLGIISVFVGVTSLFARRPSFGGRCSLHPLEWDLKFSALFTCVCGILLVTGLACLVVVQLDRFRFRGSYHTSRSDESGSSNGGSCDGGRDLEWTVTASVTLLSYLINHGPYLVLNSMGMSQPTFWSPWVDNGIIWLQLAEGVLVPCVLLLADMPHRSAVRNMLRQPGRIYRHLSDHGGFRMQIGNSMHSKPAFPPFPVYRGNVFPQRLRWSPTNLPSLQSLQPLDIDSLRKGYGSGGYTTLLSLPSSTTSFSSPYSSCSSVTSQSVTSVTTNAVDDFVFRRPSVLALFEPQPPKEETPGSQVESAHERRCDTPTPFLNQDACSCSSMDDQEIYSFKSVVDLDGCSCKSEMDQDICSCKSSIDQDVCSCSSVVPVSQTPRDIISKNMINIILAYESGQSYRLSDHSSAEEAEDKGQQGESLGDMSSLTSSESSDADSVQSVIIRQRVDQRGRVSESDITIAQRKFIRFSGESETESSSSERRIVYSEYL